MAVTYSRPRQARRATASRALESISFVVIMLLLVMKHEKSEMIIKVRRKMPRSSTQTLDDNDSGECGEVARRPCRGRGWVAAIDAHCIFNPRRVSMPQHCRSHLFFRHITVQNSSVSCSVSDLQDRLSRTRSFGNYCRRCGDRRMAIE
ncbi:hypothetical protein Y032_0041g422 [Ancylostoma ceylanicum]|uniref:Uncharacterized protein n=1 Tax=Ancylostoma ceylanicum TaxID=53326 RepID=A0A016UHZ1_9BILA|nr:hypothetical protein Y032_0041g422 [Ancylostoma ceylanicum]